MVRRLQLAQLAAASLLGIAAHGQAQTADACLVQRVEGAVVVSAGTAPPRPALVGMTVVANETVRTPAQARISLACPNGLKIVVGPDSEVALEGVLAGTARNFGLRLLEGIIGLVFKGSSGDGVQVRTPSAVAAVRSTEWAMRVQRGASEVFTREGTVSVTARDTSVQLGTGDGVDVTDAGELRPVVRWRPPRIAQFVERLGADW
jgi:hypothetical protein